MKKVVAQYQPPKTFSPVASLLLAVFGMGALFLFGGRLFGGGHQPPKVDKKVLVETLLADAAKEEPKEDDKPKEKTEEKLETDSEMADLKEFVADEAPANDAPALAPMSLSDLASALNGVGGGDMASAASFASGGVVGGTGSFGGGGADLLGASQLDEKPSIVTRIDPKIPSGLKGKLKGASIAVLIHVGKDGSISRAEVAESSVPEANSAIVEAVRKWRFKPGTRQGKPVSFKMRQKFSFSRH